MKKVALAVFLICLAGSGLANATTIVFSQPPLEGGISFGATPFDQISDDFVLLNNSSITDIRWWGGEGLSATPVADTFSIRFFANSGMGAPPVAPFLTLMVANPTRTATGLSAFPGQPIFEYESALPQLVPLLANDIYYLSIVAQSLNWAWGASNDTGASWVRGFDGDNWAPRLNPPGDLAFELKAVPEPVTMLLLASGLVGLWGFRRKFKR